MSANVQADIVVESAVEETPRVAQLRGVFDLDAAHPAHGATQRLAWSVALPLGERPWHIGLITGPSGCGKSTIARRLWPAALRPQPPEQWPAAQALIDAFPAALGVKQIIGLLSSVGFSSPPAWLRPYRVLSTGQQFRADLALALAQALTAESAPPAPPLVVFDEFTSTVDRTVAQIGSAAVAKAIRAHKLQFVAVTCHADVIDWLQPDWTYDPATGFFDWRCLRRRPGVPLALVRCHREAWRLFAPHHYLSHQLLASAHCFLATWHDAPVCFSAWLPFVGKSAQPTWREHRTVVLPDYQGVGIGNTISATLASAYRALGKKVVSTTTHPAMIAHRRRSPLWRLARAPNLAATGDIVQHAEGRLTAGFEYVGPALPLLQAKALLCVPS